MIKNTWAMTGLATAVAMLGGLALSACNDGDTLEISQGVAIQDATIVNTRDGSTQAHMTLWVDGGKIQKISTYRKVHASGTAQVVDAQGKYLVPGFQDMHTHAMSAAAQSPTYWPMFVASGITGVREMGGSPDWIAKARTLNAANAAGSGDVSQATPEILLIPGPILNGVPTAAAAIQQVQAQKAMGADFVKLVSGSRDAVLAAISESKAQGLTLAGHLTVGVGAAEASNAGQHAIEHLGSGIGILLDCAGATDTVRQALLSGQGANPPFPPTFVTSPYLYRTLDAPFYQQILDSYDEAKCQSVTQVMARNGTWQVPTLIRLHSMLVSDAAEFRSNPDLQYIDKTTATLWEQLAQQYAGTVPDSARATFAAFYAQEVKLMKVLKAAGVKMLAGSDITGIWVIPGVSLHQEFHELAAAGLTPLEILQMTTLNAAQFLGREATMGTVEEGKNADLVLLDGNPVIDVNQLDKVHAVFLKGRYIPSDALAKLKSDVAAAYKAQPLRVLSSAIDPSHVD